MERLLSIVLIISYFQFSSGKYSKIGDARLRGKDLEIVTRRIASVHLDRIRARSCEHSGRDTRASLCPLRGGDGSGSGEEVQGQRQGEWVMRQLSCLRARMGHEMQMRGDEGQKGGLGTLSEDDFNLAQSMLLQELRIDDECPICLEYYCYGQETVVLDGCGHWLCVGCAAKWARSSASLSESYTYVRGQANAFTCPLCNRMVAHMFTQLQDNGKYLPAGQWRLSNVAQLLLSYACADAAKEDECWAMVDPTSMHPSACAVSVRCGYGEEEEEAQQQQQRTVADFGADSLNVEDQEDDEQDFDDAAGRLEAECVALEDGLMARRKLLRARRSRESRRAAEALLAAARASTLSHHNLVRIRNRGGGGSINSSSSSLLRSVQAGIQCSSKSKIEAC